MRENTQIFGMTSNPMTESIGKKKQEFGGSLAIIKQMSCEGPRNEDIHSSIIEGGL